MIKRSLRVFSFCLFISYVASSFAKAQHENLSLPFTFKPNQAVYVIAVRHNTPMMPDLWQELVQNSGGRGTHSSLADDKYPDPHGRATLKRSQPERPTLDRETGPILPLHRPADEALHKAVTDALHKQKKVNVVETAEQADFVLLVQGEYIAALTQTISRGDSRGTVSVFSGNPDGGEATQGNQLVRIQAVAIPATIFQKANMRLPDNAETVRWRGRLAGSMQGRFYAPSIATFIKQFHKETLK